MANYDMYLLDELGNKYERKNLYLKELSSLQNELEKDIDGARKSQIKEKIEKLKKNKTNNKYEIKLKDYKGKESKFIKKINSKKKDYISSLDGKYPRKVKKLKGELCVVDEKIDFYKEYVDLSYDADLKYKEAKILKNELSTVVGNWERNYEELKELELEYEKIDIPKDNKIKEEIKKLKVEEKVRYKNKIKKVKEMRRSGEISTDDRKKRLESLKREYEENIRKIEFKSDSIRLKSDIKNKKKRSKGYFNTDMEILNANLADARRFTPIEVEKQKPIISYLTILIPGLGQILNGQVEKGLLFLLGSLFTYLIAIPYSLGFGNYQGEGIKGLISLAEGGLRVHKSLIFMIEGVVAIFFVIISLAIIYLSFKDVRTNEKRIIKGIRPNSWFETKVFISEQGYPYAVTSPSLILIIFIVLVPAVTTILLSFTGMDPQHQSKFTWIGIENYKMIALGKGLAGSVFWSVLKWTVLWTLGATTMAIFIGFSLALLLNNDRIKGKRIFRTIFILPWAVPAFITIMFFSIMVSPEGAITSLLFKITGMKIGVKTSTTLTRLALIMIQGWLGSSYVFLLVTGVLQAIPGDLYEAADIDGASRFDKLRKITLPLVLFQISPILIGQYTFNFNNFSIIYLFNSGGPFDPTKYGNLAGSSDILISYIYKLTMENQYQAIGAAITVVISAVLMFVTFLGYANSEAFKEERL